MIRIPHCSLASSSSVGSKVALIVGLLAAIAPGTSAAEGDMPKIPEGYYDEVPDEELTEEESVVQDRGVPLFSQNPTGDGVVFEWRDSLFARYNDGFVFKKTDSNQASPDGGIAFTVQGCLKDGDACATTPEEFVLSIRGNGNVGIGEKNPAVKLSVRNTNTGTGRGTQSLWADSNGGWSTVHFQNSGPGQVLWLNNAGGGDFIVADKPGTGPVFWVDPNGVTNTRVLKVLGGADLAENFDVRIDEGLDALEAAQPGTVVSIDPEHEGRLVPSRQAYDRAVAGVISGGGGLSPGMVLGVEKTETESTRPVALSGRVRVLCETSTGGTIRPGDLLTTSGEPGYCMKVTDHAKAQGAILGKAMGSLDDGTGLVLALVSLQ